MEIPHAHKTYRFATLTCPGILHLDKWIFVVLSITDDGSVLWDPEIFKHPREVILVSEDTVVMIWLLLVYNMNSFIKFKQSELHIDF